MRFEWDARKASENLRKPTTRITRADERPFVTFGVSSSGRLLVVAPAERHDVIRIITAREVTRAGDGDL